MSDREQFEKMQQELRRVVKPAPFNVDQEFDKRLNPGTVEANRVAKGEDRTTVNPETLAEAQAPDSAGKTAIPAEASPVKTAQQRGTVGFLGEGVRENWVQNNPNEISVGMKHDYKSTFHSGIDGASISLDENDKFILNLDDNKAYNAQDPVSSASAIQKNLAQNINKFKGEMRKQANNPELPKVVQDLAKLAHDLAERGQTQLRITNGAGNTESTTIPGAQHVNVNPGGGNAGVPNYVYVRDKPASRPAPATPGQIPTIAEAVTAPPPPPASAAPTAPSDPGLVGAEPPPPPASVSPGPSADGRLVGTAPPSPPSAGTTSTPSMPPPGGPPPAAPGLTPSGPSSAQQSAAPIITPPPSGPTGFQGGFKP
jgi:hypothetical protein